jgi:hypothetical protein
MRRTLVVLVAASVLLGTATGAASAATRTIWFSGLRWDVRDEPRPAGPGPNRFSDSRRTVWLDDRRRLHLRIERRHGHWYCAELTTEHALGYGTYRFHVTGRLADLDPNVVLGLFTWDDHGGEHHREIDVELSRWGDPSGANAQFVVQPYRTPENIHRFDIAGPRAGTTQAFDWTAERVEFWSLWGHVDPAMTSEGLIDHWVNAGSDVPTPSDAHVHVNLWLMDGLAPTDGRSAHIVLSGFSFAPAEGLTDAIA